MKINLMFIFYGPLIFSFVLSCVLAVSQENEEKIEDEKKVLRKLGNVIENGLRNFMEIREIIMIILRR